jgi:hypothetical protein
VLQIYYVKPKVWPELEPDAMEQDEYRGGVLLLAENVPPQVDSRSLGVWLSAGLDDDDPSWVATKVGLDEAKVELQKIKELIENLPAMHIQADSMKEELAMKRQRSQVLVKKKEELEATISSLTRKVAHMIKVRPL